MSVQVEVAKWGKDLGLRVPFDVARRVGLIEGARVEIDTDDRGRIIVTRTRRRFTLDDLVAGMTPEREHTLEDDGPRGAELL
jgi:antitoxin MazE